MARTTTKKPKKNPTTRQKRLQANRRVKVKPVPIYGKQRDFRTSKAWIRGVVAGRGSGKTQVGALDVNMRIRNGESWLVVSPDNSVVLETTLPTFIDVCKELGLYVTHVKSPFPRVTMRTLDGGYGEVVFRSAENPEKLRGPSKAGLWLDEASVMPEEVFKIGIAVLRHKGRMGKCILTFTPRGRQHWTFGTFFEPIDEEQAQFKDNSRFVTYADQLYYKADRTDLIHATSAENPFAPVDYVESIRSQYTALFAKQELEGEFVDLQGLLFARENFGFVEGNKIPREGVRVRYWDKAATADGGCYTVGLLMCKTFDNRYIIEDVIRGQWSQAARNQIILDTAQMDSDRYSNEVTIWVEQEGGSSGKEIADQFAVMLAGYPYFRDVVGGQKWSSKDNVRVPGQAKITRAIPLSAGVENGLIYLKRAGWNSDFLEEIVAFPESAYADQADAASGAFNKLTLKGLGVEAADITKAPTHGVGSKILEMQSRMRGGRGLNRGR